MKQFAKLFFGMCLLFAGAQSAFAVPGNYLASVLNTPVFPSPPSCYSYENHTVPTSPAPPFLGLGEENVGVMCFQTTAGSAGGTVTDGHVRGRGLTSLFRFPCLGGTTSNAISGTYGFVFGANVPYWGGGWIDFGLPNPAGCMDDYDIVVNNVSGGLAGGFQLIKRATTPNPNALVLAGTAFYQGPQPAAPGYYAAVLNGCYSFLSESVLTSPTPSGPGKDLLGLICFVPGAGATNPSGNVSYGRVRDLNGVITSINNPNSSCFACTGTYNVNNLPGYGMGTVTIGICPACLIFDFAVFGVGVPAPGVAQGFQFALNHPVSLAGSRLEGGTAYFQQQ
ncbi:MAG TPA: hypothetical protein VKR31_01570 [Rhizomicrobium sp.]|nr:hypothetical protein [Rhizomicrobium sp.]